MVDTVTVMSRWDVVPVILNFFETPSRPSAAQMPEDLLQIGKLPSASTKNTMPIQRLRAPAAIPTTR